MVVTDYPVVSVKDLHFPYKML